LAEALADAQSNGKQASEAQAEWLAAAKLCTLPQAVATELQAHGKATEADRWAKESALKSHQECKVLAQAMLKGPGLDALESWCAEKSRTKEGWYRTLPGVQVSTTSVSILNTPRRAL